jgi:two-component system, NarL family, sensor histidine kinase UhpB
MRADPHAACAARIVFVDDDQDDADIAAWRLTKAGVVLSSTVVSSEATLTAELLECTPDLIISDFTMPGFDGWGALRVARALVPEVPFIFHSGSIGQERCRIAMDSGVYGCVEKDKSAEFIALVRRALSSVQGRGGVR